MGFLKVTREESKGFGLFSTISPRRDADCYATSKWQRLQEVYASCRADRRLSCWPCDALGLISILLSLCRIDALHVFEEGTSLRWGRL